MKLNQKITLREAFENGLDEIKFIIELFDIFEPESELEKFALAENFSFLLEKGFLGKDEYLDMYKSAVKEQDFMQLAYIYFINKRDEMQDFLDDPDAEYLRTLDKRRMKLLLSYTEGIFSVIVETQMRGQKLPLCLIASRQIFNYPGWLNAMLQSSMDFKKLFIHLGLKSEADDVSTTRNKINNIFPIM